MQRSILELTPSISRDNQLDLHVQPQADASEQNNMRQLSGGERSFSTVCFILALWEAMVSPFRCLDEFDVFMDNVNRALSMKMIMKTAQKHQDQQFIFLTPLVFELAYQEKMAHVNGIKERLKKSHKFCKALGNAIAKRIHNMGVMKRDKGWKVVDDFATCLHQRRYSGGISFNHDMKILSMAIQPQASRSQQNLQQLSGGERSFSTCCFILALWNSIDSPIRCMDEFDVFMDNIHRFIALEMVIGAAEKKSEEQFIFLTPLDLSNLKEKPGVSYKVIKMPDPKS